MNDDASLSRRKLLTHTLAGVSAMPFVSVPGLLAATAAPDKPTTHGTWSMPATLPTGGPRDFDFLVGTWKSVNRRLKKRWVGSTDWDVFPNTLRCESRLGGIVNIDEVEFPTKGWAGMTVRTYDVEKRQWSLYWINSRQGVLFPPVVGGFTGDVGRFYGDDTDEGRPIKCVFQWRKLGPDKALWEQAFSLDGKTWETNWSVEHTRVKG
ncbi:hypothetical protein SAMN05443572_102995 [Myxococcus fulvus]|uniref:DUF1579 domain-containing protein n=1 Tax=Myxococcus fulvus TaxID=33 RepID=A0A511SVF4_MYXFU|nr:hypothetical protein [Myxococcus fulvus]AKF86986.1 hypothetical protein MFUL124B02_36165 [Myxococcus fulvus 124B02]GEN05885.1 hypothetical protein MFU01_09220 [Myxococcus fulvus]SET64509.1 hypothetical protein SAMN05443572_102995 [Myxococcus fulvus]